MRKIAIAAAVSLAISGISSVSYALGLGEIEMYSSLNETLDAEIAILSASESELQGIQVSLAPSSAFARAGLEQSPVLSSVMFNVDRRPDGLAVVKVTSDTPVLEPFLNFLIEVNAPGSVTLVREYTVLLNPPTLADSQSLRSTPASTSTGVIEDELFAGGSVVSAATSASSGAGVAIDLGAVMAAGNSSSAGSGVALQDNFEANGEVTFTESAGSTFESSDRASADTMFLPDNQVITSDTNAIFGDEFNAGRAGDVIDSVELSSLVNGFDGTSAFDSDAQGAGDLIDLSGVLNDSGSGTSVPNTFSNGSSVTEDGIVVEIDDLALSSLSSSSRVASSTGISSRRNSADIEVSGSTYRIRSQDTLWRIANSQKASGTTPHQMMVALLDANPNAFVGGNMNRLRNGAVLQIPTTASQQSVNAGDAFAVVESWTRNNRPPPRIDSTAAYTVTQPATVFDENGIVVDNTVTYSSDTTYTTELSQNLDSVNQRYEEVQTEIVSGSFERDELQGRVDNLTDNMQEMKSLITVRENELNQLQDEVSAAESNAAAIDEQISQLSSASANVAAMQRGLSDDLVEAQVAIERKADVEKNLATAEAEAQSVRLSTEEDILRSQLAALEMEKRDLEASSELDKVQLVSEAEADKNRLLAQAQAERGNILSELEAEKARISSEAELEIARIRAQSNMSSEGMTLDTQAERDRVAAETERMQVQLQEMEAEKARLLQEAQEKTAQMEQMGSDTMASVTSGATDEPSRVKDRLAQMQEEAKGKVSDLQASATGTDTELDVAGDSDADGGIQSAVSSAAEKGKAFAAGGAATVGGLMGAAPLQASIGNRKTLLAIGAGVSLFGFLGAWAVRSRKKKEPTDVRGVRPRGEGRPVPSPQARTRHEQEEKMYGDANDARAPVQPRNNSGAAAAAAAAAAVTGTAAVARSRNDSAADAPSPVEVEAAPVQEKQVEEVPPVQEAAAEVTLPKQEATVDTTPAVEEKPVEEPAIPAQDKPLADTASEVSAVDSELEERALDDTISEAEVYLRYGLHGQAEDLLKTAIDRSPNNEEYHFKLLENYHDQKNSTDFHAVSATFKEKFPSSDHLSRIDEMGNELVGGPVTGSADASTADASTSGSAGGLLGAAGAAAAGAAAVATGAAMSAKNAAADGMDSLTGSDAGLGDIDAPGGFNFNSNADADDLSSDLLDQTIDPGTEFSVDELQATGNLGGFVDDEADFGDMGGLSLDDVDLAPLDDDGTMNLEEIAGDKMSGSDLGTLDLTNPDIGGTLGDFSLEDADLNSLDDIRGDLARGPAAALPTENLVAGGTDEMETMLDLAKAYIDMGDTSNASTALKDIAARGNPLQQAEAAELLKKLT